MLEADGDTVNLYEDHFHSYPSGSCRYIEMLIEQRASICLKAKICLKCHDPSYIWKPKDHNHSCPINPKKKSKFTCSYSGCLFHMWACTRHKTENKFQLERFKEEYRSKYKINLCLFFNMNNAVKAKKGNPQKNRRKSTGTSNKPPSDFITSKEAAETLEKKFSEEGEEPRINEGRSIFMMGETKGITRPINIFYDSGFSGMLLREGVQYEL